MDGYYVTESLACLQGYGKVQIFISPKEFVSVHLDSLSTESKIKNDTDLTEYEILEKLENQGTVLKDAVGLTFRNFFQMMMRIT